MKKLSFLLAFFLACNLIMAQNYFIKFEGIEGESNNSAHRGWSDIESFNQELNKSPGKAGTSRTRSTVYGKYVSVLKKMDKSSPKIMEALTKDKVIPIVEIEIVKSGNVIFRYELTNVAVIKYAVTGENSNALIENFTISFEKQKVVYTEYDSDGRRKGSIETEFN